MPEAFYHEQTVKLDGEDYRLAIDFAAIDATEQLMGRDYDSILSDLQQEGCPVGTTGKVVWGLLRRHHHDVGLDQIIPLIRGNNAPVMGLAISHLLSAAFPTDKKEKGENPPKPRGA